MVVSLLLLASCKSKKETTVTENNAGVSDTTGVGNCKMDFKNAKALAKLLKQNQFDFMWLSAKFSTTVIYQGKSNDFNVTLKSRKDSVIWMSFTDPLLGAVEGARVMLTCDSVKFMDRINKKYFVSSYDTIRKLINVDELDFEMLQSLLIGNSVEFYEEDEKIKSSVDRSSCKYQLGTLRKRKLKRVLSNGAILKEPAQSIWLDKEKFKILRNFFTDFNTNRTFDANYERFEKVDSLFFPFTLKFDIKAERNLKINIEYQKINVNKSQNLPFNIPSGYEQIKSKK
jgi:hypothetical protein